MKKKVKYLRYWFSGWRICKVHGIGYYRKFECALCRAIRAP